MDELPDFIPNTYEVVQTNLVTQQFLIAITGSTTMPDYLSQEVIDAVMATTEAVLIARYSCVGTPSVDLSPTEYEAWIAALGFYSAYEWTKNPNNLQTISPNLESVKIGPVIEKYSGDDGSSFQKYLVSAGRNQLKTIQCIKEGLTIVRGHSVQSYRANQEDDGEIIFTNEILTAV